MWVSPFRHLRIIVYLPLPAAFRSLSRLSSALSAKASALRPLCLSVDIVLTIIFCSLSYLAINTLSFYFFGISTSVSR